MGILACLTSVKLVAKQSTRFFTEIKMTVKKKTLKPLITYTCVNLTRNPIQQRVLGDTRLEFTYTLFQTRSLVFLHIV